MATDRGGGPRSMSDGELEHWLATARTGAVCAVTAEGRLRATPAVVTAADATTVRLMIAEADAIPDGATVCVVADEFETYEGIRGVIVQGVAARGTGGLDVAVRRRTSFSFARPTANGAASE